MNANAAARPWAIFDDEGLAQPFLQMLRQKPAHQINWPAGAEGDDDPHRSIRPWGLGMGALDKGQGKGAGQQRTTRGFDHSGASSAPIKGGIALFGNKRRGQRRGKWAGMRMPRESGTGQTSSIARSFLKPAAK